MKLIREGDTVYHIYHMSNRGIVQEVYEVPVTHSSSGGAFTKMRRVKFLSQLELQQEKDRLIAKLLKNLFQKL